MFSQNWLSAIKDFRRARSRATLERVKARLTGESTQLLCYDDVHQMLKAKSAAPRSLRDIPIDAIIGSLGRCDDFTRGFLPLKDQDKERWAGVELAMTGYHSAGLPPIEVYQIGDVYFVLDGNHRVSVAKQLGATHIQAYVTEFQAKVPPALDDRPDDLIVKAEYAEFLRHTHLDKLRPEADLSMSVAGRYGELEEHISVHRYFMGIEQNREVSYEEAVAHWYDEVYFPVMQIIREQNILHDFPNRTEADLYLWILKHREELDQEAAWEIRPVVAAGDLVDKFGARPRRVLARAIERILHIIVPGEVDPGPAPGKWRRERGVKEPQDRLFAGVLVAIDGAENGWHAVEQALKVAQREGGRLIGLHVVASESPGRDRDAQAIQAEFDRRCEEAGVPGQWVLEVGDAASKICERVRWLDLVVANLADPPGDQPIARLSSGFRTLVQRCPAPVLAVPQASSNMNRALLAYDGSPKAEEALFVSTYLAGQWNIPLVVVTALEREHTTSNTMKRAQKYLANHGVEGTFVQERGPVGEAILSTAQEHKVELIVMGGYGFNPVLHIVLGSAVDQVLRESQVPVLICR